MYGLIDLNRYKTRTRTYMPITEHGTSRSSRFAQWSPYTLYGTQECKETLISTNHKWLDGHWSGGGYFSLTRDKTTYPSIVKVNTETCKGPVIVAYPTTSWVGQPALAEKTDDELFALGGTAISRCEPTDPSFSISQFLGELRKDGLPRLPDLQMRSAVDAARKSGGNYLNVEFGWKPIERDLRAFLTSVRNSHDVLNAYHEESGKGQRRSFSFPQVALSANRACAFSTQPGIGGPGIVQGSELQRVSQKIWFSGRFVYHVPATSTQLGVIRRFGSDARRLLGAEMTPEVAWNLAPWTWAADWFGNTGDVLHNVSALGRDGMVMNYGYIMCHTFKQTIYSGLIPGAGVVSAERIVESKQRRMSSPYGFGVSMADLSDSRVAVLAALGLSRV